MTVALGVDVGGSSIKYAPVSIGAGKVLTELASVPTPPGADAMLNSIAALANALLPDGPAGHCAAIGDPGRRGAHRCQPRSRVAGA